LLRQRKFKNQSIGLGNFLPILFTITFANPLYRPYSYDSALARQAFYTTSRFGVFLNLSEHLKAKNGGANLPIYQKMLCSLAAGGIGSFIGCPADLILIRM